MVIVLDNGDLGWFVKQQKLPDTVTYHSFIYLLCVLSPSPN